MIVRMIVPFCGRVLYLASSWTSALKEFKIILNFSLVLFGKLLYILVKFWMGFRILFGKFGISFYKWIIG